MSNSTPRNNETPFVDPTKLGCSIFGALLWMCGAVAFFDSANGAHLGRLKGLRPRCMTVTPDNMIVGSDREGTLRMLPAIPFETHTQ